MFEHGFSIINRPWSCLEAVLLLMLQLVPAPVWVINTVRGTRLVSLAASPSLPQLVTHVKVQHMCVCDQVGASSSLVPRLFVVVVRGRGPGNEARLAARLQ